jgi:hypothetical protein
MQKESEVRVQYKQINMQLCGHKRHTAVHKIKHVNEVEWRSSLDKRYSRLNCKECRIFER